MKLHTEKEFLLQGTHFAFELKTLFKKDPNKFKEIQDYYPFPVYINNRKTLDYHFANEKFIEHSHEIELIAERGAPYLKSISNPNLYDQAVTKAKKLDEINDHHQVCNYLQSIQINGTSTPFVTSKILVDDQLTLNTPFFPSEINFFSKVFKEILPQGEKELYQFLRFQTLTKREKQILKLVAQGLPSKLIADQLCISTHSISTHRKNIYKKLDVNNISFLVRLSILMDILE